MHPRVALADPFWTSARIASPIARPATRRNTGREITVKEGEVLIVLTASSGPKPRAKWEDLKRGSRWHGHSEEKTEVSVGTL